VQTTEREIRELVGGLWIDARLTSQRFIETQEQLELTQQQFAAARQEIEKLKAQLAEAESE
jgi:hypothetical protein